MANSSIENKVEERGDTVLLSDLRYSEVLSQFEDVVGKEFMFDFGDIFVYRTAVTNPPTDFDTMPNHRKEELESGIPYEFQFNPEDVAEMEYQEKKDQVTKEAMSVHETEVLVKSEAIKYYERVKAKYGEEAAELYVLKRGRYIMRLHITPEVAAISGFSKKTGHANVLLKRGITIKDILDTDYGITEFSYN